MERLAIHMEIETSKPAENDAMETQQTSANHGMNTAFKINQVASIFAFRVGIGFTTIFWQELFEFCFTWVFLASQEDHVLTLPKVWMVEVSSSCIAYDLKLWSLPTPLESLTIVCKPLTKIRIAEGTHLPISSTLQIATVGQGAQLLCLDAARACGLLLLLIQIGHQ